MKTDFTSAWYYLKYKYFEKSQHRNTCHEGNICLDFVRKSNQDQFQMHTHLKKQENSTVLYTWNPCTKCNGYFSLSQVLRIEVKKYSTLATGMKNLKTLSRFTQCMEFSAKTVNLCLYQTSSKLYQLNNHTHKGIQSNHPYCGPKIPNDLRWSLHINSISRNANATLGFLRRNIPENCIKRTLTYSWLGVCVGLQSGTLISEWIGIDKLRKLQNGAIWFIKKDHKSRMKGDSYKKAIQNR